MGPLDTTPSSFSLVWLKVLVNNVPRRSSGSYWSPGFRRSACRSAVRLLHNYISFSRDFPSFNVAVHWLSFLVPIPNIVLFLPSVLEYFIVERIAKFDFLPPLHSDHAPFTPMTAYGRGSYAGVNMSPLFCFKRTRSAILIELCCACLVLSALTSISFHLPLLSLVLFTE